MENISQDSLIWHVPTLETCQKLNYELPSRYKWVYNKVLKQHTVVYGWEYEYNDNYIFVCKAPDFIDIWRNLIPKQGVTMTNEKISWMDYCVDLQKYGNTTEELAQLVLKFRADGHFIYGNHRK